MKKTYIMPAISEYAVKAGTMLEGSTGPSKGSTNDGVGTKGDEAESKIDMFIINDIVEE